MKRIFSGYFVDGELKPLSERQQNNLRRFASAVIGSVALSFLVVFMCLYALAPSVEVSHTMAAIMEGLIVLALLYVIANGFAMRMGKSNQLLLLATWLSIPIWCFYLFRSEGELIAALPIFFIRQLFTLPRQQFLASVTGWSLASLWVIAELNAATAAISLRYLLISIIALVPLYLSLQWREAPRAILQMQVLRRVIMSYAVIGPLLILIEMWWPMGISLSLNTLATIASLILLVLSRWLSVGWVKVIFFSVFLLVHVPAVISQGEKGIILMSLIFFSGYVLLPRVVFLFFAIMVLAFDLLLLQSLTDGNVGERIALFMMSFLFSWVVVSTVLPLWLRDVRQEFFILARFKKFNSQVLMAFLIRVLACFAFMCVVSWPLFKVLSEQAVAISFTFQWLLVSMLYLFVAGWFALAVTEVAERRKYLLQLADVADAAAEKKSHFLTTLSHEMRTPLNGVMGMLQLLEMNQHLPAKAEESLGLIRYNGEQLTRLVEDLIDTGRLAHNKLTLKPNEVALVALVKRLERYIHTMAAIKEVHCEVVNKIPAAAYVVCDEARVRQVIDFFAQKLLYAEDITEIEMCFYATGTGFDVAFESCCSKALFLHWTQLNSYPISHSRSILISNLMSMMQVEPRLEASGSEDKSVFVLSFNLPLQFLHETKAADMPAASASAHTHQQRVLVVDDAEVNRLFIELGLQKEPLLIDTASSGAEALNKLSQQHYDVVLTDISMPTMSGEELLQAIRAAGYAMPLMAVTGNVSEDEVNHYLALGFADVVHKPVDMNVLRQKLVALLRH